MNDVTCEFACAVMGANVLNVSNTHLYTWVERGTVRVKCPAQGLNTMPPVRALTPTAPSGVEHTNHEATAFPHQVRILHLRWLDIVSSTYILMGRYNHSLSLDATTMVSKNCPTIGEHVVTIFVTQ